MLIYIFTLISSITMALSLCIDNMWLLGLIGLTPYFYILFNYKIKAKKGFYVGLLYGFSFFFVLLHWIMSMHPLSNYGLDNATSIFALVSGWIFLSFYCGIWLAFIPYIFLKVNDKGYKGVLLIPSLWILVEFIQQIGILGFPWGRLALSQIDFTLMTQSASLFGSLFITFLVVLINCLIAKIITDIKNKTTYKTSILMLISIFILNLGYGYYSINKDVAGEEINVAVIQGNLSSNEKWGSTSLDNSLNKYLKLSRDAYNKALVSNKKLDYIVWPETAIPITLKSNNKVLSTYKALAKELDTTLVVGAFDKQDGKSFNSIFAISPEGVLSSPYYKRQLVPFGEFLPFEDFLSKTIPFLGEINLFENRIFAGEEASLISTDGDKIGGLICFESIFPKLTRDMVKEGAKILVVGTNDSWFKDSNGLNQHLKHSRLRAIESNRYLARSANTGISTFIDPHGRVLDSIGALEEGYIINTGKLISETTLYTRLGDIMVVFAFIFIIYMIIKSCYKTKSKVNV